jgi:hypothetical protein
MSRLVLLAALAAGLLPAGLIACGTSDGGQSSHAEGGVAEGGPDAVGPGDDSRPMQGTCGWGGFADLDASTPCALGSDCHPGQICIVAEGCFCTSEGRCIDQPCDGGVLSMSCAESVCRQAISGTALPDAGVINCFVSGC